MRSPSFSPTPPINEAEEFEETLKSERASHQALVDDHGQPCYPIEHAFGIFKDPGRYKDIMNYWERIRPGPVQCPLTVQLNRWNYFRRFQKKTRLLFVPRLKFHEFQQQVVERRQRHGLSGNVHLSEDLNKHSKLDDWIEYQDFELQQFELLETDVANAQAKLVSSRKALADAGLPTHDDIQEVELGTVHLLRAELNTKKDELLTSCMVAKEMLSLAECRLKAAESNDLGEHVYRTQWIQMFKEEVKAAQIRLDAIPREGANSLSGGDLHAEEGENDRERMERRDTAIRARSDQIFNALISRRLAAQGLEAAHFDEFGETIEKAALIKSVQEEVQSAQAKLEEARKLLDRNQLELDLHIALARIAFRRSKVELHQVLLRWIEQQRKEIADACPNTDDDGGQGGSKSPGSSTVGDTPTSRVPGRNKRSNRKRSATDSVLHPDKGSKVTKASSSGQEISHQKANDLRDAAQPADKTTTDISISTSKGKAASKPKDATSASLQSVPSPESARKGSTRQNRKKNTISAPPLTGRKTKQQPANAPLRRSTRVSKQPDRFVPG